MLNSAERLKSIYQNSKFVRHRVIVCKWQQNKSSCIEELDSKILVIAKIETESQKISNNISQEISTDLLHLNNIIYIQEWKGTGVSKLTSAIHVQSNASMLFSVSSKSNPTPEILFMCKLHLAGFANCKSECLLVSPLQCRIGRQWLLATIHTILRLKIDSPGTATRENFC